MKIRNLDDLNQVKKEGLKKISPGKPRIAVGLATCGIAAGGDRVFEALQDSLQRKSLDAYLTKVGCIGYCKEEPLVNISLPGKPLVILHRVSEADVDSIVEALSRGDIPDEKALCRIEEWDHITDHLVYGQGLEHIPLYSEVPFFKYQKKVVLRNAGLINPEDIEEYIAVGGYFSLYKALKEMNPDEIIEIVKKSGLRGRGGAGFPTGLKWSFTQKQNSPKKYIICNADEGDPGAYMNRNEMESDPHMLIEGMLIGAYTIGSDEGIIYVRAEYPKAIERLQIAIQQAEEYGLLGDNIFGTDFNFHITIAKGAGAFVCGEETAMISSIEGKPGRPRPRPPFPAEKGLWGKPTNINNVETWCNIPVIISRGGDWFASIGTERDTGTKVFSLVGKVDNVGLVEVPLGTPLSRIVYDIGNGGVKGKKIKAVQTGGPSGGCLPISKLDTPVEYETLKKLGSIMGSGGIVVMDENTCMVETARYFINFTSDESCGKCAPCREGLHQMENLLTKICNGEGKEEDIDLLGELGETVQQTSLCGLGQTAPNPLLTTLKYFKEEYLQHIRYKKCPAAVCEGIVYAPCEHTCPLDQDIPSYVAYIARKEFNKALEVILRTNPFPRILGRVCNHPCETRCRLGETVESESIRALKRFVADYVSPPEIVISEKKEKKVAVIGSGPAGLSAAYFLAIKGYSVTIFESLSSPGGMLRVGIPAYRLPKEVLDKEIERITSLGVDIQTNVTVGKNITLSSLFEQGFNAILIAVGLHKGVGLNIPGENTDGVIDGLEFLRKVNTGEKVYLGKDIIIVGGGNTAIDAARTAWRINPNANIQILYRRTRLEMPAIQSEVEEALLEGIKIQFLVEPIRIIEKNGRISGLECLRTKLGEIDETGRWRPIPVEGSNFIIPADTLVVAVGQRMDNAFLERADQLKVYGNTLMVNPDTLETAMKGVFAAGDIVSGPATVVEAAASGRTAAESIDRYLSGKPLQREYEVVFPTENVPPLTFSSEELEELATQKRAEPKKLSISERRGNFKETESTLSLEEAVKEARRCLRCDLKEGEK